MNVAYVYEHRDGRNILREYKVLDAHVTQIGSGLVTITGQITRWKVVTEQVEKPCRPQWLYKLMKWPLTETEEQRFWGWAPAKNLNSITVQSGRVEILEVESL